MSMVTSYPSPSLHRSTHLGIGAPYPHVLPVLPYNKPAHKVAQQLVKGRCSSSAATSLSSVPQATPASALTALSAVRERDCGDTRPRKRHLAMSMIFPAPQYLLKEDYDYNKVVDSLRLLKLSGYYYENLNWQDADIMLKSTDVGTFLVRNSRDNRFLFSLSVQTERGPTSVRIHYNHGVFRLDCEHHVAVQMPTFPCVVELVEYYISLSKSDKGKCCVWLDGSGRRDLPIKILKPKYNRVNSLQHLCRLAVNTSMAAVNCPKVPQSLTAYLQQYPHKH